MRIVHWIPSTVLALCFSLFCNAQSATLVISLVYGGAGCGTAGCSTYKNDFIEIYNRSATGVSVDGWSVQYASSTGSIWFVTNLPNVTIPAGGYFLVAETFNNNGVNNLPTPDVTGTITLSSTSGKVALVSSTIALSGTCPTSVVPNNIVDFVGYGTPANCSETANAPQLSATTAAIRGAAGCTETNNNSTDFSAGAPNPRNSATAVSICTTTPVELTQFSAAYDKNTNAVSLKWSTSQEANSKEFQVQRNINNQQWNTIATVQAAGNSNLPIKYQYTDWQPQVGINAYRLQQIDIDGQSKISAIVNVNIKTAKTYRLAPNPAKGYVYVNGPANESEPVVITIADLNGRVIRKINRTAGAGNVPIDLTGFTKGIYTLRYVSGANTFVEKLVINNE
ncbi:MAG TPA: T9SS type A sorting domain-containing protein [Niastella sp.]